MLVFVMLLVGCSTDQQTMQLIEQAEQVMIDHPDSALNIIRSVDAESIRGEEDMAHYRLVMAEACYYNRIVPSRDSIAQPLFDYYLKSDDHAKRARALYQYALVMSYHGENSYAMKALIEARKSLQHVSNMRLEGLVHRSIGDIYNNECLYNNALESFGLAKNCFAKADLPLHSLHSSFMVASTHLSLRNYVQGIEVLKECENEALSLGDNRMVYDAQVRLCYAYIEIGDYDSFVNTYERMSAQVSCLGGDYYCFGAFYQAYQGNYLEAEKLYDQALCFANESPLYLNYIRLQLYVMKGDYKSALMQYLCNVAASDSDVMKALDHNVLNTQIDLIDSERTLIEERAQIDKMRLICVIAVLVLIIATILLYARYLYVKRSRDIANYISVIAELEQSLKTATSNESSMIKSVDFIELNKICEIYYQYGNTTHISGKVVAAVNKSIDSLKNDEECLKNLENIVNSQHDNLLLDIREQCPKINNKEYRYIIYYLHGFSSRSIAMLLDIDTDALSRLKYKVKAKLRVCENEKIRDLFV